MDRLVHCRVLVGFLPDLAQDFVRLGNVLNHFCVIRHGFCILWLHLYLPTLAKGAVGQQMLCPKEGRRIYSIQSLLDQISCPSNRLDLVVSQAKSPFQIVRIVIA